MVTSSDSDSSFSDSDELVYGHSDEPLEEGSMERPVPLQDALKGLVAMNSHETDTSATRRERNDCGAVVQSVSDYRKSVGYDKLEGSQDCINCTCGDGVMSLHDLEQYGIKLDGLIDELSEMSDKLVRCGY